jgi:hypothetical protein
VDKYNIKNYIEKNECKNKLKETKKEQVIEQNIRDSRGDEQ